MLSPAREPAVGTTRRYTAIRICPAPSQLDHRGPAGGTGRTPPSPTAPVVRGIGASRWSLDDGDYQPVTDDRQQHHTGAAEPATGAVVRTLCGKLHQVAPNRESPGGVISICPDCAEIIGNRGRAGAVFPAVAVLAGRTLSRQAHPVRDPCRIRAARTGGRNLASMGPGPCRAV
ncbi:hypothetical protein [Amycolatopsis anabasis]|uniref:hypothetical protein n=1 Tax=Amycolatopsis anabasis TaxID=1840409 RepID=UPI00131BBE63|nr:hypothetical protein [Amycolatopsis anabasis]